MFALFTKKYIEESARQNEFTCVYVQAPSNAEIAQVRGKVYSLVNIKGPDGLDAVQAANIFLDTFESIYFSPELQSIPNALEKATKTALFKLNDYFVSMQLVEDIIFDFCCAVVKDDLLYVAKVEDAFIYIIRDNKAIDIGRGLHDISNPKLIETGSGVLEIGDKIVLANKTADDLITDWSLLSRYSEGELNRLIPKSEEGKDKMSFLVIEVDKEEDPEPIFETTTSVPVEEAVVLTTPEYQAQEKLTENSIQEKIAAPLAAMPQQVSQLKDDLFAKAQEILKNVKKDKPEEKEEEKKTDDRESLAHSENFVQRLKSLNIQPLVAKTKKIPFFQKNTKAAIPVGIVALVLLVIIIRAVHAHMVQVDNQNQYNVISSQLKTNIAKVQSSTDYQLVDSVYTQSQRLLKQGEALKINNNALASLFVQIEYFEDKVHDIVPVQQPQILSDLSLNFSGATPNDIDVLGSELLISSPNTNSVYTLNTDTQSSGTKIESSQITAPVAIAKIDESNAVIYDKKNGVLKIDGKGNVTQIPGLADIQNITNIATFQSKLYFLDPSDGIIYRSVPVGSAYSIASSFISDEKLANAQSIAVDGNVFVATPSAPQGVLRFYAGTESPFQIGDLNIIGKPLGPITYIYDNEFLSNIYVLDPQNNRIVVLQKPTGSDTVTYNFVRQYVYIGTQKLFTNLLALAVDKNEKNMYLLDGTKVLKVNL